MWAADAADAADAAVVIFRHPNGARARPQLNLIAPDDGASAVVAAAAAAAPASAGSRRARKVAESWRREARAERPASSRRTKFKSQQSRQTSSISGRPAAHTSAPAAAAASAAGSHILRAGAHISAIDDAGRFVRGGGHFVASRPPIVGQLARHLLPAAPSRRRRQSSLDALS